VKRVHIVGRKNSGKTTLVVDLVRHLTANGLRVGTIKHTHHRHELDTPGKDSYRHCESGAEIVGVLARQMNAVFWPTREESSKHERYDRMTRMFEGCDLLLVEGDSQTDGLKIEVWRADSAPNPLAMTDDSIAAVVTDDPLTLSRTVLSRADVPGIAVWLQLVVELQPPPG